MYRLHTKGEVAKSLGNQARGVQPACTTRRMFVIETASRAWKITILIKRSKVRKVNHAFLPEGVQIENLTQASCHA